MDRVARRGPLARAPGALKGGHFRNCQHFVAVEGGIYWRKNKFSNEIQCRKTERGGPFGVYQHPFCRKTAKKLKGENFYFRKKISQCRKKLKGGPFGIFQHPFCRKTAKKIEGGTLGEKIFSGKKVSHWRKKLVFGLARYGMLRGKTGKTFLVQFARPNSAICAIIFCRTSKNYFGGQFVWIEKKEKPL